MTKSKNIYELLEICVSQNVGFETMLLYTMDQNKVSHYRNLNAHFVFDLIGKRIEPDVHKKDWMFCLQKYHKKFHRIWACIE